VEVDIEEAVHEIEVWESNWAALEVFSACLSQFTLVIGMSGARYTGLPAPSIAAVMTMRGIPPDEQWELLLAVQVMERAALKEMNPDG
jgi:hypothetical protein